MITITQNDFYQIFELVFFAAFLGGIAGFLFFDFVLFILRKINNFINEKRFIEEHKIAHGKWKNSK